MFRSLVTSAALILSRSSYTLPLVSLRLSGQLSAYDGNLLIRVARVNPAVHVRWASSASLNKESRGEELNAALRKLYLRVHPDLFHQHEMEKVNLVPLPSCCSNVHLRAEF